MRIASLFTGLLILAAYAWLGAYSDSLKYAYSFKGESSQDYYASLARGLQQGHLYMDTAVDPRYLSAEPAVRDGAVTLLDASVYKGHYYLYFGIVPVVLVYLPYHLLTGSDISGNAVTLLFVTAGFLVYLRLFADAKKRHFPGIGAVQEIASVFLLAVATCTPSLVVVGGFYETSIAAGYFFHALTWLCIFNAWHAREKAARWVAFASLAAGLAVGCRPDYVFALPVVALFALLLIRRDGGLGRLFACAVLPAAVVGAALGAYNYLRFGSPLEFGIHYQLDAMILEHFPLYRLSFFWSNLKWYFLLPPAFSLYFPYVFPMNAYVRPAGYYGYEQIHGQLAVALLALLCLAWFLRAAHRPSKLRALLGLMTLGFVCMYLSLAFYGNRSNRYIVDFQGVLVADIVLVAGLCSAERSEQRGAGPRLWRAGFVALALAAVLSNFLGALQLNSRFQNIRPQSWALLSRIGNYPSYLLERAGLVHYGPIRLRFRLPPYDGRPLYRPLVATGLPGYTDVVYVAQHEANQAEFAVEHNGYGSIKSSLVVVDPSKDHELEVDLGSLYPPYGHAWFGRRSDAETEALKTTAMVKLDGKPLIRQRVRFYDSPPGWVFVGRNPAGNDPAFTGTVTGVERLPARTVSELQAQAAEPGMWRMRVTFPFNVTNVGQPLLGSGSPGRGNLLLVQTHADHTIRFSVDEWGVGLTSSADIAVKGDGLHEIAVFVGAQVARADVPREWGIDRASLEALSHTLCVWMDGQRVWTAKVDANLDTYGLVSIGTNPQGFSSASAYYAGSIESLATPPAQLRDFALSNVYSLQQKKGALKSPFTFPVAGRVASGLPLLGVGVAGDGNLILARAEAANSYRIVMDEWGYGLQEGLSVAATAGEHTLVILLGPQLASNTGPYDLKLEGSLQALRNHLVVALDDRIVGNFTTVHHPGHMDTLTPGANPQGFSTAEATFAGSLFERVPLDDGEARKLLTLAAGP